MRLHIEVKPVIMPEDRQSLDHCLHNVMKVASLSVEDRRMVQEAFDRAVNKLVDDAFAMGIAAAKYQTPKT